MSAGRCFPSSLALTFTSDGATVVNLGTAPQNRVNIQATNGPTTVNVAAGQLSEGQRNTFCVGSRQFNMLCGHPIKSYSNSWCQRCTGLKPVACKSADKEVLL